MNKIEIVGRLTKDVELATYGETNVVRGSVAVGRNLPDKDGNFLTDYIDFTAFNRQADYLSQHASKGSLLEIVGTLRIDTYEKDGQTRKTTYVLVDYVRAYQTTSNTGEYKKADANDSYEEDNSATSKTNGVNKEVVNDDDLPF